jgi:acyl-CoA reductase-like NAD-dependent aldehyde dehydrogenase
VTTKNIDWIARSQALTHRVRNFINGRWQEVSGEKIEKSAPRDGKRLYQFGVGEARDVDTAVTSAHLAFSDGRWARLAVQHRKSVLQKLASLIEANREELALLECLDVGKPITDALTGDVPAAAAILRYSAEAADKLYGKVYSVDQSSLSYELRRPIGVVAGIVGWNFPLVLAAMKIGPALATGNSLVLKPSELTSLSAGRVAELAIEAGLPEGVFNVVHGAGSVGAALAHHRDVSVITFTGSTQTGKKILIASGQSNMKRLILECGGKAPNIVFEDSSNLDGVADAVVARAFWNQGQVCTASSRLLVQESIKDELTRKVIAKSAALRPGDPLRDDTTFGAVVSQGHKEKVLRYVEEGQREGANILYRGSQSDPVAGGFYVSPIIFDNVFPTQRIAQEEIFGPVLSVLTFRDEDEAVRLANSTIYGLSAIMWTKDLARAHRVTQGIHAGSIVVNATDKPQGGFEDALSAGGHKESGIGVEGGLDGLMSYTSNTAVQVFV